MFYMADTTSSKGNLIEEEEMERGSVSYQVYFFYLQNIGYLALVFCIIFCLAQLALQTVSGFWLANWSEAGLNSTELEVRTYYIE